VNRFQDGDCWESEAYDQENSDPCRREREQNSFCEALYSERMDILRALLADNRIVFKTEYIRIIDFHNSCCRLDALFVAAHSRIWPRVIGNNIVCVTREHGQLRSKLDELETESSWQLSLCVKRRFTARTAARVNDVLREVCSEWTRYHSEEAH
jgi:hypothetical protein